MEFRPSDAAFTRRRSELVVFNPLVVDEDTSANLIRYQTIKTTLLQDPVALACFIV